MIKNQRKKYLSNYINLECQNEQFDVLIKRLHEITESKNFDQISSIEKLSIINQMKNLVEQQKFIQSKIGQLKQACGNSNLN